MDSTESITATTSVAKVLALNDADLGQFIQRHRLPDSVSHLPPLDGWDRLSEDERRRLAERLETKCETEAYHELVNNGARPLYPVSLIQEVYSGPDNCAEIPGPWQEFITPASPLGVFQRQLQTWQDFRRWQNHHRGRHDQRGCRAFRDYAETVKHRLERHSFIQPFELDEDPKRQDKLTTWIEYLNYEYWWLDKHTSDIERLQPEHDRLWQELVEANVLGPHETKEFVRTSASPTELQKEEDVARKVVKRAESEAKRIYVLTQEDPGRFKMPRAQRISKMKVGRENLLAAKRRLEHIKGRNSRITEFIRGTFDHAHANGEAARHRALVQWVLDQVPLVEAEMEQSKVNKPGPDGKRTRTKRGLSTDEDSLEERPTKRSQVWAPRTEASHDENLVKLHRDRDAARTRHSDEPRSVPIFRTQESHSQRFAEG